MSLLSLNNVHIGYGGIKAVKGIQLHVDEGELVALIGANGAGKTTTLKAISGLLKPTAGELLYQGQSLVGVVPHRISQQGLALVPEGRGVFPGLTIEENLAMGAYCRNDKAG
ncbi:MAG: ATP-binding cassette domain-containing protein, partial [Usitatibacteraceae bacterium]